MGEFELIRRFFANRGSPGGDGIELGIGDDCALLAAKAGFDLAISTDMLVEGRHFLEGTDPGALGWKALAVNLSDLAAMGAEPLAFTLALALPTTDATWLDGFAQGLFACADAFGCRLIGGDTTGGPRTICITVFGRVPEGRSARRSGARGGDDVWVSGTLGDAAFGLRILQGLVFLDDPSSRTYMVRALEKPVPRIALGIGLRGIASAMIDISDGLTGDLGHILEQSSIETALGANIYLDALPISAALAAQPDTLKFEFALAGGDDYELCFTAPAAARQQVLDVAGRAGVRVSRIGTITEQPLGAVGKLKLLDGAGRPHALMQQLELKAYDHFAREA